MTQERRHGDRTRSNDADEQRSISEARLSRRRFAAAGAMAAAGGLAGCFGVLDGDDGGGTRDLTLGDFRGSGPLVEARDAPGGTSIADLPDLDGELTVYMGGGESGLYLDLLDLLASEYEGFSYTPREGSARNLSNQIVEETNAGSSRADVFLAIDAGSLGAVADAGATTELSDEVKDAVRSELRTDQWVGIAGRARSVPYNTNHVSADEVPDSVQDFPDAAVFENSFGWAPTYPAFQSFVTAMRVIRDDSETRAWLEAMLDHGVEQFPDEFRVSNSAANGEITAGFANHYYAMRVRNGRPDAPIDLAFTRGDAGALINVSGAAVIGDTDVQDLAMNFLRHLVSSEAQEFFATRTFAYPTIDDVDPVGGLPSIDELEPPDVDLAELSDTDGTVDLLRETDVLS